jgi:Flp pilus assembly protein TadD
MWSRRWPHATTLVALVMLDPRVGAQPGTSGPIDVPAYAPGPAKFAVTPFENHVINGRAFDWLVAEAPFEIAEKTEAQLGLDPVGGPLFVPGEWVPAEPDTVAAFGKRVGADFVVTGWFDRLGEPLRVDAIVWRIDGHGGAAPAGEAQETGTLTAYHELIGRVIGGAWTKAIGAGIDVARAEHLARALSKDLYPVAMMGRGLGYFTGAIPAIIAAGTGKPPTAGPDVKSAQHDLERAVFLDPKLYEAQRLLGELELAVHGDAKAAARAAAKFNYAADLAPDDIPSLRAAAGAAASEAKWELAKDLFHKLVARRPWDIDARYQLGAALWQLGDAHAAQTQLDQVVARVPDHLAARRVLVLIHASRSDTGQLVAQLEAIAARAPNDLDIASDLASAYGALGQWRKAVAQLETIASRREDDLALFVRIGDAYRKLGDLVTALRWYTRAQRIAPESSLPVFALAQAELDAGRLADAVRTYTGLQRFTADLPAVEEALGAIAMSQDRVDDAAWYLRRAAHEAPRSLPTRQAMIAAELMRRDFATALVQLDAAQATWPGDATLHYLAGVAHAIAGEDAAARAELTAALEAAPGMVAARGALSQLESGAAGAVRVAFTPLVVRPWGDAHALQAALDRYAALAAAMAIVRAAYQGHVLAMLGTLGSGPYARSRSHGGCPVGELAQAWAAAQRELASHATLGAELEAAHAFIARHDEAGLTSALLPNARTEVAAARRGFSVALADASELRAEWVRWLSPELRAAGCSDRVLSAAVAHPADYHIIEEDAPERLPTQAAPRTKPRSTFFVDNTRCGDPVDVWIDGALVGQVAPARRSALVADAGKRTLCLLGPGAAQCGDRGTVREVFLHDGWTVTMHCVK